MIAISCFSAIGQLCRPLGKMSCSKQHWSQLIATVCGCPHFLMHNHMNAEWHGFSPIHGISSPLYHLGIGSMARIAVDQQMAKHPIKITLGVDQQEDCSSRPVNKPIWRVAINSSKAGNSSVCEYQTYYFFTVVRSNIRPALEISNFLIYSLIWTVFHWPYQHCWVLLPVSSSYYRLNVARLVKFRINWGMQITADQW